MGGCKRSLQGFETYEKATDLCIPVIRSVVDKYGSQRSGDQTKDASRHLLSKIFRR